jgi:hypothetical protein
VSATGTRPQAAQLEESGGSVALAGTVVVPVVVQVIRPGAQLEDPAGPGRQRRRRRPVRRSESVHARRIAAVNTGTQLARGLIDTINVCAGHIEG